jgi:hypothetical protein
VRRREFIALVGGAVVACKLTVWAQQPGPPGVGFLSSLSPQEPTFVMPAFHQGLNETGYETGAALALDGPARRLHTRSSVSHNTVTIKEQLPPSPIIFGLRCRHALGLLPPTRQGLSAACQ